MMLHSFEGDVAPPPGGTNPLQSRPANKAVPRSPRRDVGRGCGSSKTTRANYHDICDCDRRRRARRGPCGSALLLLMTRSRRTAARLALRRSAG